MAENFKCLECFLSPKNAKSKLLGQDAMTDLKTKFTEYDNAKSKRWSSVETSARDFGDLVCDVELAGCHPDEVFPPTKACDVLTSLLSAGIRIASQLSEVLKTVYHCVRLSKKYHHQLYNTRKFWCILFENILTLPDQQFFESVMIFIFVVGQTFTESTKKLSCNSYFIVVDDYLYMSGSFFPQKMFPIFKKLQHLEEKQISSRDTAFTLDYKKVVSPLFAASVAEKEWYSLNQNRPVDFLVLLAHLSLRRPAIVDLLFVNDPGIPLLNSVLRETTYRRMHPSIVFAIDAMLSLDTHESRYELLHKLLHQLDYPLIVKFASEDELPYLRALAQKIIFHTLSCLDIAHKSDIRFNRPHRSDLLNISLRKLKEMISHGGIDDMIFALMVVAEREDTEHQLIVKEKFQDLAVRILDAPDDKYAGLPQDTKDQLIGRALNLMVSIGPLEEKRFPYLMRHYTVKCLSKYYFSDDKDIKLLSRVCTVNICQTSFDKKLELFRTVPLKTLVDEIYGWYHQNQRNLMKRSTYFHLMPVTVKLIHYYLCIMYHMKTSGVLEQSERRRFLKMLKQPEKFGNMFVYINGENWTKMLDLVRSDGLDKSAVEIDPILGGRMAEVFSATVFDRTMPERYNTIAVACLAHLMHDEKLDVSKYINDKLIAEAEGMYSDMINKFYLSDGGDFMEALSKSKMSKLAIKDKKKGHRKPCRTKASDTVKEAPKAQINTSGTKLAITSQHETSKEPVNQQQKAYKKAKVCALSSCPRRERASVTDAEEKVEKMKKCGKCRAVSYCSKDCQVKHWSDHKKVCKEPA